MFSNVGLDRELRRWETKTGLRLVPYSRVHLLLMRHNRFQQVHLDTIPNYIDVVAANAKSGPSFSVLKTGRVIYSAGLFLRYPGVAEAWMLTDTSIKNFKLALCCGARTFFDLIGPAMGLHRAQIVVRLEDHTAVKWGNWLKFKNEGVLRQYGADKSDHIMMSRLYK